MNYKTLNARPNELTARQAADRLGIRVHDMLEVTGVSARAHQDKMFRTWVDRKRCEVRKGMLVSNLNDHIPQFKKLQYGKLPVLNDTLFNLHVAMQPDWKQRGYEFERFDFSQLGLSEDHVISFSDAQEITGYSFSPTYRSTETNGRRMTTHEEVYVVDSGFVQSACDGEEERLIQFLQQRERMPNATDYNAGLRETMRRLLQRENEKSQSEAKEKYNQIADTRVNGYDTGMRPRRGGQY